MYEFKPRMYALVGKMKGELVLEYIYQFYFSFSNALPCLSENNYRCTLVTCIFPLHPLIVGSYMEDAPVHNSPDSVCGFSVWSQELPGWYAVSCHHHRPPPTQVGP